MLFLVIILAVLQLFALAIIYINHRTISLYKFRLQQKDRIINMLIRALPVLFVENFRDPDHMKERDGEFAFHVQTRPEYNGSFIEIKWICSGRDKPRYDSLVLKYFKYLKSMGLQVHPVLLGDKPYSGKVMLESYYELDEDETMTEEEIEQSVKKIGNV